MSEGCRAPKRQGSSEPCGYAHAEEYGPCPEHEVACWRHHQDPAAIEARRQATSKGGRPAKAHTGTSSDAKPVLEPDDITLDPLEALKALSALTDERREALHALLQLGDVQHAARRIDVETEELQRWIDEDHDLQMAIALMQPYGPDRLKDHLTVGASICAKRLVVQAHKTEDSEQLLRIARVLFKQLQHVDNAEVQRQMAELRESIESLREEQAEDIGA